MNTKQKGDIGVAKVLSALLSKGFSVCLPWGDSTPYDLIIDAGKLYRIQIKLTSKRRNGAIVVKTGSVTTKKGKPVIRSYGQDPVDYIIAYDYIDHDFYVLPKEVWSNIKGGQIFLRILPSKNKQKKNINDAAQFKNAWHLIKS